MAASTWRASARPLEDDDASALVAWFSRAACAVVLNGAREGGRLGSLVVALQIVQRSADGWRLRVQSRSVSRLPLRGVPAFLALRGCFHASDPAAGDCALYLVTRGPAVVYMPVTAFSPWANARSPVRQSRLALHPSAYNHNMLTSRQERILCKVVDDYLRTGQPVASKSIAADAEFDCGPSTVRNELALLEEQGLLAHPHVSAGRVPTDAGHRYVVDRMLSSGQGLEVQRRMELSLIRREVEQAMRTTSETLSQMTNLLAVVSAPSLNTATIRHVEVLALQPEVAMVVVITSSGGVSKLFATFDRPVDSGLLAWAGEYLRERLVGYGLGARMLQQRLIDPSLSSAELAFLQRLVPAFGDLAADSEDELYVDGTARLFAAGQIEDAAQLEGLVGLLERRVSLLRVLRSALGQQGIFVRIGNENEIPAMRSLALVATGYGVAQRKLGAVSVIGPVRMDYAGAIVTVREAAQELSRFVEDAYAES